MSAWEKSVLTMTIIVSAFAPTPLTAGTIEPVHVRAPISGKPGNGARFLIGEHCVTITPFHVIAGTAQPLIRPAASAEFQIGPNDQIINREPIDISYVVERAGNRQPCQPLPPAEAVRSALTRADRQLYYVNAGGEAFVYPVRLTSYNANEITITLADSGTSTPLTDFFAGVSGAVVVFDGVPVGIVQRASGGIAIARRLDKIQDAFSGEQLDRSAGAQPKSAPAQADKRVYAAFDADQLPPEYRAIVDQARRNKAKAERIAARAKEVRKKAMDASGIAMQYEKNKPNSNGYANFDTKLESFYSGQIYQSGVNYGTSGYGVSVSRQMSYIDDTYYCNFVRDVGCQGPAAVEYQDNPGNTHDVKSWFGYLNGSTRLGLGYLSWQDGSEAWLAPAGAAPVPGYWRLSNGFVYEGEIQGSWDGRGVLWTPDGKVSRYGVWKNGQPVN